MKLGIKDWLILTLIIAVLIMLGLLFFLKRPVYPTYTAQQFKELADSAAIQALTKYSGDQKKLWGSLDSSNWAIVQELKKQNANLVQVGKITAEIKGAIGGGHGDVLTADYSEYSDAEMWIRYYFGIDSFAYKQRDHILKIKVVESDSGNFVYIHDETANKDVKIRDAEFIRYKPHESFWKGFGLDAGLMYRNPLDGVQKYENMALYGVIRSKLGSVVVYRALSNDVHAWGFGIARHIW